MTIPDLLDDLVEEILCRVPATDLKQLRCISKIWNDLFTDMRFARKHFEKAAKQSLFLMLTKDFRIFPLSVNLDGNPSAKLKCKLNLLDPQSSAQFEISDVFHCGGLLLCISRDISKLVICNPLTGETRWIKAGNFCKKGHSFVLGYYQDKKQSYSKKYKVLSINRRTKYSEIYELNSDSWRILDDDIAPGWVFGISDKNVSLKGKTYFFGKEKTETRYGVSLLRFDFSTEKAGPVPLPYECYSYETVSLSVVREEKLCLLLQRESRSKTEIWVTNKIDETNMVSWSKVLALDLSPDLQISDFGSFVLDEENKVVVCCERWMDMEDENMSMVMVYIVGEDNEVTQVDFGELLDSEYASWPTILDYVPSLIQIERAGGKRKRDD